MVASKRTGSGWLLLCERALDRLRDVVMSSGIGVAGHDAVLSSEV